MGDIRGEDSVTRPVSGVLDPNATERLTYCKMTGDVFKRVQVHCQPLGGTLIAWDLWPGMATKSNLHFYVDFGRSGTDEWETLNTLPIVNDCLFMDPLQRHWDELADFYYRIRLVLPDEIDPSTGEPRVYLATPKQANGVWCKKDWLLARWIARKEYLYQRKAVNKTSTGFILKRRRWGQINAQTTDWDTEVVQYSNSEVDYGTGFIGGYFPARDFTVSLVDDQWPREFKVDPSISIRNNIVRHGRAVAYPYVDTFDIYVRRDTGERWFVQKINTVGEVGGVPVVVLLQLGLAPVTDIIYKVPLEGRSSSSSPSGSSGSSGSETTQPAPDDYRVGAEEDGW